MAKEIERRWLVKSIPDIRHSVGVHIQQGYLTKPGDLVCTRVRIIDGELGELTLKLNGTGISCDEFNYSIPLEDATILMESTTNKVEKMRFKILYLGQGFEFDVFLGPHTGFTVVELELTSEDQVVILPDWVGEEITGKKEYSNLSIAFNGVPE